MNNFYPKINKKKFLKFYAIPVKNNQNGKIIPNLFIFKIIAKKGDPSILYSMTNNGLTLSIRLYGQCANLTAEEIHKEIIERSKYKEIQKIKIFEEEDEMDDPYTDEKSIIINNYQNTKYIKKYKINKEKNIFDNNEKYEINKNNNINNELFEKDRNSIEKGENLNVYMNNKTKKKKNKKKHKMEIYRMEISNIDKNVDEKILNECFQDFNCKNLKIYKQQNGLSNGFMEFTNEENTLNCIKMYNDMTIESKKIQLKLVEYN